MLIESIIKRPEGTTVEVAGVTYEFKTNSKGDHVCDVKDKSAQVLLLAIKEGYRAYGVQKEEAVEEVKVEQMLVEETVEEETVTADDDRSTLEAMYFVKYGKAANPRMGLEKLRKSVSE